MILIIQNGNLDTQITKYLDEDFQIIKTVEMDLSKIDLDLYSIIIILGGHQSLNKLEMYPHLENVITLIKKCESINKPVLGICLGCQLIGYALGCDIETSEQIHMDYDTKILTFNNIFRCHYDHVIPNDSIEIIDTFESMPYLFRHNKLYGIQCHPDIPPSIVIRYQEDNMIRRIAKENRIVIEKNNQDLINYLLKELRS